MGQATYGQEEGHQGSTQAQGDQQVRGASGGSSFHAVPTISISERYDSNILRSSGRKISDFITDIRPGARVNYSSDMVDGMLRGSVLSSIYAENPGLNYVGGYANLTATLDRVSERIIQGLGLRVQESITYYPEQPAFITPEAPESDFTRGIQARRNNSLNNVLMVQSRYAVNPLVDLNSSYSFQTRRYLGQPDATDPDTSIRLFDVTTHMVSAGPSYHLSPNHSVGASYSYRSMSFEPSTSGTVTGLSGSTAGGRSFEIHGLMATWKSVLTRELVAEASPGVSLAAYAPDNLIWTMRASVQWIDQQKSASLTYSRGLYPGFYAQAALLVSNVVSGAFSYNLSEKWNLSIGGNYAVNTREGQQDLRFESIGVNGALRYTIYEGVSAAVTGTHNNFTIEQSGLTREFDRQIGMLTLSAEWN